MTNPQRIVEYFRECWHEWIVIIHDGFELRYFCEKCKTLGGHAERTDPKPAHYPDFDTAEGKLLLEGWLLAHEDVDDVTYKEFGSGYVCTIDVLNRKYPHESICECGKTLPQALFRATLNMIGEVKDVS